MRFQRFNTNSTWLVRQEIEMNRVMLSLGFTLVMGLGIGTMPSGVRAADDVKETPAPDWSKYTTVSEVTGELVKADDKKITLRLPYVAIRGQQNKFPPLSQYPVAPPVAPAKNLMNANHDYEIQMIPESLVRTLTLPSKLDANGKKVSYTEKEKEALKTPKGVKGYAASISDLTAGSTVNVILIRDKSLNADKVTDNDLRVKFAIIQTPASSTTPPKKN